MRADVVRGLNGSGHGFARVVVNNSVNDVAMCSMDSEIIELVLPYVIHRYNMGGTDDNTTKEI